MKFHPGDEVTTSEAGTGVIQMGEPCEDGGYMYLVWFDSQRNEWAAEKEISFSEQSKRKQQVLESLRRI